MSQEGCRPDPRPHPASGILCQEAEGTVVLLSVETGRYFSLDPVGGRVWSLCDGTRTVGDIVEVLAGEYEASRADLERDVRELLEDLKRERLVGGL